MRFEVAVIALVVAAAMAGVLFGFWKIDMMGLALLAVGAAFLLRPGHWRGLGLLMIVVGLLLWFDVLGVVA